MIQRRNTFRLAGLSLALALAAVSPAAMAQIFDDVAVHAQDGTTEVAVRFNANVRFKRAVVSSGDDLITIYFELTGLSSDGRSVFEESRTWNDSDLAPPFKMRYFSEANQPTEKRLEVTFSAPVQGLKAGPGEDEQSFVLSFRRPPAAPGKPPSGAPVVAEAPLPPATAVTGPLGEADQAQADILRTARDAAARGDYETAVAELNRVLNMPPGLFTQEAQELIGFARERLGENARAKAEYDLYLKLYPDGPVPNA